MRVYILLIISVLFSLVCHAVNDDEQEVTLVGDKNYGGSAHLVYDGIDVSNYQKDINWRTTASDKNIKFVYIKATEGATHKQHRYRHNIENARRHGIKVGSYHFMTTTASVESQFQNFISMARPEEQDLVPLLDVEKRNGWTIKQLQDSVMKFANMLEEYYGCKPMIYASSSYFNNYLGAQFAHYPLFIARYAKSEPNLYYGAKWILWQFSDRGRIDGIDALVDLSRFNRGSGVKDITYRRGGVRNRVRRNNGDVPRPKVRHQEKPEVPMSPKQRRELENNRYYGSGEKTEAQKRGEEAEKKRLKEEEKRRKEEAKRAEQQRKADEKKRKEIEKRQRELEKKHKEEEKKRQAEEKKRQEQLRKQQQDDQQRRAREQAQNRMKAQKSQAEQLEQQKQQQLEQQRRAELEQAKSDRLKQQQQEEQERQRQAAKRYRNTVKPVKANQANQSSADNDEIHYNSKRKK